MLEINIELNITKPEPQGLAPERMLGNTIHYGSLSTTQSGKDVGWDSCFPRGEISLEAQERVLSGVPAVPITSFKGLHNNQSLFTIPGGNESALLLTQIKLFWGSAAVLYNFPLFISVHAWVKFSFSFQAGYLKYPSNLVKLLVWIASISSEFGQCCIIVCS